MPARNNRLKMKTNIIIGWRQRLRWRHRRRREMLFWCFSNQLCYLLVLMLMLRSIRAFTDKCLCSRCSVRRSAVGASMHNGKGKLRLWSNTISVCIWWSGTVNLLAEQLSWIQLAQSTARASPSLSHESNGNGNVDTRSACVCVEIASNCQSHLRTFADVLVCVCACGHGMAWFANIFCPIEVSNWFSVYLVSA